MNYKAKETNDTVTNNTPPWKNKRGFIFVCATFIFLALTTSVMAFGVRTVTGANRKPDEGVVVGGVREFRITAKQWSFSPSSIKVNPGEEVRFIVTSSDVFHGFAINELNINESVAGGQTTIADVVVPANMTAGVYTMYCSIFCGLGHPYFKGEVTVGNPDLFLGIGINKILPYAGSAAIVLVFAGILFTGRRRD